MVDKNMLIIRLILSWLHAGHRFSHPSPSLASPLCGEASLLGILRHGSRLGAERRRIRYTAERCNEWKECWWPFGMTAMATGGVHDSGHGWLLALRHALGDAAQSEVTKARAIPRLALSAGPGAGMDTGPGLFD